MLTLDWSCRSWLGVPALVCLVAMSSVVRLVSAVDTDLIAKRQGVKTIISAHKKAQAYVEAALGDHASLEDMVCSRPAVAGFVTKNPSVHLSPTVKDRSGVQSFLQEGVPIYDACQVYVSDTWQFIYIRQPKASSSSMLHTIRNQLCGGTCKPPHFYQEHDKAKFEAKWASYFVFTVVRNPWTRALSAYSMFNRGVLFQTGPGGFDGPPGAHCGLPFLHFTEDVFSMRNVCNLNGCCAYIARTSRWVPNFVDVHVADHGHCMFLPGGEPLVDYIGVSEAFDDSWADIVGEINRRVGTAFVAAPTKSMNGRVDSGTGASEHSCSGARVLQYFNDTTARNIARQFALDIVRLGYL